MRTLIITGGTVNIDFLKGFYKEHVYDFCMGVDKGAEYAYKAGIKPDMVLGDFDSASSDVVAYYEHIKDIEVHCFPVEKDETDTHLALLEAIKLGSTRIDMIGGIGSRMDHTLANIHIMKLPLEQGILCRMIDESNIISLANEHIQLNKGHYPYVSLIPLTSKVEGITTHDMKYPLHDYTMVQGISVGISNEILNQVGAVTLQEGILVVIQSRDL
ncbi:thiamine diphosphokinase [Vallitalea pronyensis]|uniref:Thiamine diphosphokinase n=1 Tax=Vallitalea pronyensis TaxID=1348613 RepID=A0A8J8MKJ1_9FIRM|nr:thiamine diphosphokinase [Vallitalea pronyensis]QUI22928.1 thiamine diphosphokinase [Vallitalea pronyensis]